MKVSHAFFIFAVCSAGFGAEPLSLALMPRDEAVAAGAPTTIDLVVLNADRSDHSFTAPATFRAQLTVGTEAQTIELHAVEPVPAGAEKPGDDQAARIPGGSFVRHAYTFSIPPDLPRGRAILELHILGYPPARAVVDLSAPVATADWMRVASSSRRPTSNLMRAQPAAAALTRSFANRLAAHEPIYFIYGPHTPAAKLQFSFKYKLLDFTGLTESNRERSLQFGYTQRSLWDTQAESSPFFDTSYIPELMYQSLAPKPEESDRFVTWLGFQAGLKHESNGRAGPISRSLNTAYVRPAIALGRLDGWYLLIIPELSAYLGDLSDNRDLEDYRGYGRLHVVFGRNDGPTLSATAWSGKDFKHDSLQLDLTLPIRTQLLNFETYLLVQYFDGYGESLLNYREPSEAIRAGISLVR